jgi:hypothetical protein
MRDCPAEYRSSDPEARGERSHKVGGRRTKSPEHMATEIPISRCPISRYRGQFSIVEDRWQATCQRADNQQVSGHKPSGFGKSQVQWTQTSCRQKRRNPDGRLDHGRTRTGHMDHGLVGRG